jgi:hypothetical protein
LPGVHATTAAQLRRQRVWQRQRVLLRKAVEELERIFGQALSRELRDLRRDLARLDRRLAPK